MQKVAGIDAGQRQRAGTRRNLRKITRQLRSAFVVFALASGLLYRFSDWENGEAYPTMNMMDVFESSLRNSKIFEQTEMLWLCRKTDWFKLLHLPNVSWWQSLVAVACLVVVIWAILRLVARVNEDVDPAEGDREMLQRLDELYREGDLTEVEFRSIKSQIVGRLSTSWKVAPNTGESGETADRSSRGLPADRTSEDLLTTYSEAIKKKHLATQSNQPESFASPTKVPEPPQDTSHLSEGLTPSETENSQGHTEAGPTHETQS